MKHEVRIGSLTAPGNVFLAPMAGITDLPFRKICRSLGADYAVGEMAASKEELMDTAKTSLRYDFTDEAEPRAIQLLGADPKALVKAAKRGVVAGAQIVDYNCGCPAKKVCSVECGAALLRRPDVIRESLTALVAESGVPVTLKFRTGWSRDEQNAEEIAEMAQEVGVSMLVLHGRTRADGYKGEAEYETIRRVKSLCDIPLIANGDITSGKKANDVLKYTHADGVMVGRASFGNPWIFKEITDYLNGVEYQPPSVDEILAVILRHQKMHMDFYGEYLGVRSFRKHLGWYLKRLQVSPEFMVELNSIESAAQQEKKVREFFELADQA